MPVWQYAAYQTFIKGRDVEIVRFRYAGWPVLTLRYSTGKLHTSRHMFDWIANLRLFIDTNILTGRDQPAAFFLYKDHGGNIVAFRHGYTRRGGIAARAGDGMYYGNLGCYKP